MVPASTAMVRKSFSHPYIARQEPQGQQMNGTRSVVVTGSSTGIGWGIAKVLIHKSFRVFGSVRKQADADRLVGEFGADFVPLLFDITDAAAVRKAADLVGAKLEGRPLSGLVNNAGIAVPGPLLYLDVDEFRHQIEVNV